MMVVIEVTKVAPCFPEDKEARRKLMARIKRKLEGSGISVGHVACWIDTETYAPEVLKDGKGFGSKGG